MRLKTEYSKKALKSTGFIPLVQTNFDHISQLFTDTMAIFQFPSAISIMVDDDIDSLFHIWQKPDDYIKVKMKYFKWRHL